MLNEGFQVLAGKTNCLVHLIRAVTQHPNNSKEEEFPWRSQFQGMVWQGRKVMAARGCPDSLHCILRQEAVSDSVAVSLSPLHSIQDHTLWNGLPTLRIGLYASINAL